MIIESGYCNGIDMVEHKRAQKRKYQQTFVLNHPEIARYHRLLYAERNREAIRQAASERYKKDDGYADKRSKAICRIVHGKHKVSQKTIDKYNITPSDIEQKRQHLIKLGNIKQ